MGLYFGTDGIRGVANREITPDLAFRCGNALAAVGAGKIVVGRDTRRSGDALAAALAAGALSGGCDVIYAGVAPTPGVAFLASAAGCFGVVISASHNPAAFNGIKIFSEKGVKLSDAQEEIIERHMAAPSLADACGCGSMSFMRSADSYTDFLVSSAAERLDGLKIVLDCANGATCETAVNVFGALGAEVFALGVSPDGENINDGCGSLHPSAAAEAVVRLGADAAFCFDGDGDRVIAVDENGRVVDGDMLLYILAAAGKKKGKDVGVVVGTSHTNMGVEKALDGIGVRLLRADIGDKYVREMMEQSGAALGGEQSGHIIMKDFCGTGDGVLTAVAVSGLIKHKRLSLLADAKLYPQVNLDIVVADKMMVINHEELWKTAAEIGRETGGRILVRASGTEPKIRIMAECLGEEKCRAAAERLAEAVRNIRR